MKSRTLLGAAAGALLVATPVWAGEGGDLLRQHLYEGSIGAGIEALRPLADGGDQESKFGLGVLTFFSGLEGMAQALYRHGLAAPSTGPMGPELSLPMPTNPNPDPLDYEGVRTILSEMVGRMDEAKTILVEAGASGDYVVPLDALQFRIDIDGDGIGDEVERLGGILAPGFGRTAGDMDLLVPEDAKKKQKDKGQEPLDTTLGFDRADAIWLAGYSQVFASWGDFMLAHDFSELVNSSFHRLFPKAGLPMQNSSAGGSVMFDPDSDNAIADLIAAIHSLNWPVVDPDRLRHVLVRLGEITSLSRENWKAILAETDDNREWIPSPRQTSMIPEAVVTDEIVAAWHDTLDTVDQVLAGQLLLPHWRFKQGLDLKAYFETATRTDLVMFLTGYGAIPFLRDGPIADPDSFSAATGVMGEAFPGYALWFN